jgi:hypothetical protein
MRLESDLPAKAFSSGRGQTLTEYLLIVLFIGIAGFSAYAGLGLGIKAFTNSIVTFVTAVWIAL